MLKTLKNILIRLLDYWVWIQKNASISRTHKLLDVILRIQTRKFGLDYQGPLCHGDDFLLTPYSNIIIYLKIKIRAIFKSSFEFN